MATIYMATCLTTGLSYIGQSIDWKQRMKHHLKPSAPDCYFHRAIKKYGKENFIWTILEDNIPKDKLNEREIYWIAYYNTYLGDGYNETPGGDGGYEACHKWQKDHPEKFKAILEEAQKQAKLWREQNSEQARENSLQALEKARVGWQKWYQENSEQAKENQLKAAQAGAKATSKQVYCQELNQSFSSISEASRQLHIDNSSIAKVCKGLRKTAGGYHWSYVDDLK